MRSSLTLRMRGRGAGRTWPITRREQKGPELTKTRRKERRRKLVSVLNKNTGIILLWCKETSVDNFFALHPLTEIKEEEKTKESSAAKADSKRSKAFCLFNKWSPHIFFLIISVFIRFTLRSTSHSNSTLYLFSLCPCSHLIEGVFTHTHVPPEEEKDHYT